eukprot:768605-Hanusia_phi.AAC.4
MSHEHAAGKKSWIPLPPMRQTGLVSSSFLLLRPPHRFVGTSDIRNAPSFEAIDLRFGSDCPQHTPAAYPDVALRRLPWNQVRCSRSTSE